MWRQFKIVSAAVIGLLVSACADSHVLTDAGAKRSSARETDFNVANIGRATADDYDAGVPVAYYQLSLVFSKRTGGFTPPVQARAFGYMGLALYEAVVPGMPDHRSIARQLNGVGPMPDARGIPYNWPLV